MSAAGPYLPRPPSSSTTRDMDPYRTDARSSEGAPNGGQHALPHIKDLVVKAKAKVAEVDVHTPMGRLLQTAESSANSFTFFLDHRKPDRAYVEYLVCSEIVLNFIPRHKDFPVVVGDRGKMHRLHKDLLQRIQDGAGQASNIKDIIIRDNSRNGTQQASSSSSSSRPQSSSSSRPLSSQGQFRDAPTARHSRNLSMTSNRSSSPEPKLGQIDTFNPMTSPPRKAVGGETLMSGRSIQPDRPEVRPKPPTLYTQTVNGNHMNGNMAHDDPISARFALLRATGPGGNAEHQQRATSQDANSHFSGELVQMPSPSDFKGSTPSLPFAQPMGIQPYSSQTQLPPSRPLGPRDPPSRLGKVPLDTKMAITMPKAPSPTYSPARNMPTPGNINPPRQTPRSMVGTGGRSNSMAASSISSRPPSVSGDNDSYFPKANGQSRGSSIRRKSVNLSSEFQISSEKLFDYRRMYSILIIDVRSRELFDEGHMLMNSQCPIMCIEPSGLRDNMSANEVYESLVLSPDNEQQMFDERNSFDLVIYFDQSTPDASFLQRSHRTDAETVLKRLFDALYEFNEDKPLQRAPILLQGGLDAWVDLLGKNALQTSTTATIKAPNASKPLSRRPVNGGRSELYIQKKRRRVYNPLDQEEAMQWAETARSESIAIGERPSQDSTHETDDRIAVPLYRDAAEFLRRYPEAPVLEQQSMVDLVRRMPPPPPTYPPQPGVHTVPSRPPPTAPRVSYSGVHDRDAAPFSTGTNRSNQLATYIPPSQLLQNVRVPKTGLINFGVTCYMNATIQALSATIPLTNIFRDNSYRRWIQQDNWKGSRGLIPQHYANLVQNLWKGDVHACRPSTFRNFCARLNREWGADRQQDAKEFFDFLIDYLHEDLNVHWNNPPAHVLTDQEEAIRESMAKPFAARIEWSRYSKRERSVISDLFAGQHSSRLRCTTCGHTSTTYEAFWSISVEIPRTGQGNIYECLRSYCSEERLSGDEVWRCPRCKKEREATKQITLTRAPRYLVIHFKRFSASHQESARKVRTPVDFPLTGFNLERYMLPPPTTEEERKVTRDRGPPLGEASADVSMTPPYIYNAYAVLRHLGNTLSSGHYISLVKDPGRGCWRQFNDERVNDFDPEQLRRDNCLQNEEAYIVFYERVLPA